MVYVQVTNGYVTDCIERPYDNYIPVNALNPPDIMNGCYRLINNSFVLDEEKYKTFVDEQEEGQRAEKEQRYKTLVQQYIHERYSIDDETALINEAIEYIADSRLPPEKYNDYRSYVEECKTRARKEVYND